MDLAAQAVSDELLKNARDVDAKEDMASVATISSRDAVIGGLLADAFDKVGKDGVITVRSPTPWHRAGVHRGMQFDKATSRPTSSPTERMRPSPTTLILLHQGKISAVATCSRCSRRSSLGQAALHPGRGRRREALSTLVVNKIRGTFNAAASRPGVRRPAQGHDAGHRDPDGARSCPEVGLKLDQIGLDCWAGPARGHHKDNTTIIDGSATPPSHRRVNQIKAEIENTDLPTGTARSSRSGSRSSRRVCYQRSRRHESSSRRRSTASRTPSPRRGGHRGGIVPGGGSALIHAVSVLEGNLDLTGDEPPAYASSARRR